MANPRSSAARTTQHPPVDRPEDLALPVPAEEAPGADEVDAAALSVAVIPDWRREELARKYSDDEPIERERGFYHPYG